MAPKPEEEARAGIDRLLAAAGWAVQDCKAAAIHAAHGVALREFQLKGGYGEADCARDVAGCNGGRANKRSLVRDRHGRGGA